MNRPTTIAAVLLACLGAAVLSADEPAAPSPVDDARTLYLKGHYDEARQALEKVLAAEPTNERAVTVLSELDMELGHFEPAEKRADDFVRANPKSVAARVELAWALYRRGKVDRAYAEARKAEELDPKHLGARFLDGLILWERGERPVAKRVFETFVDAWRDMPADTMSAEDATLIGQACTFFALADRNVPMLKTIVNDIYPHALKQDPRYTPAMVASGMLFLEKYNVGQARNDLEAALRVNPSLPEALVGLTRCDLEARDFIKAHERLEKAAAVAPDSPDVILLDGLLSVYDEDYAPAIAKADKVLAVNPAGQDALGLKGACLFETDKLDDYAAVEKLALAVNPKCSGFYEAVASVLVTRHRDGEAEKLLRRSVELAPEDSGPATMLGLCLMRLGRETEAYGVLDAAFKADSFNAILLNTLNLLDKMKAMETTKTAHFTIRWSAEKDKVLAAYLGDFLERTWKEVSSEYRFDPPNTLIEVFPDHKQFSVRITGTPNIGTVGASMGPVIAVDSPVVAPPGMMNWQDVLRHEYTHTVTLCGTDMRIAHWFTEALAVAHEKHPFRYEWRQLVVDALERGELMPVLELNYGFTRAKTQQRRQLAYCEAYLLGDFIAKTWGPDRLADLCARYKAGDSTAQAVEAVIKIKPEALDAMFKEQVRKLAAESKLRPSPVLRNREEIEKKVAENPADAELRLELARIKLARGDPTGAALAAMEALKLAPANPRAHAALAAVRLAEKNVESARAEFRQALALGPNEPGAIRGMLALAQVDKNEAEQLVWMARLSDLEPLNPALYKARAALYLKQKNDALALDCLVKAVSFESQDYGSRREIIRILMARADYAGAVKYVDEEIGIWPYEKQIHEWAATAFDKLGEKDRAEMEKGLIPLSKAFGVQPPIHPPTTPPPQHVDPVPTPQPKPDVPAPKADK